MTLALTLLCRVIRRRLAAGEALEAALAAYPRLTPEETAQLKACFPAEAPGV